MRASKGPAGPVCVACTRGPPPPRRAEAPRPNVLVTLLGSLFLRHAAAMVAEEEEEEQQQRGKQRGR